MESSWTGESHDHVSVPSSENRDVARVTHNANLVWQVKLFIREAEGRIPPCHALHGCLETQEAALLHFCRQLATDAAGLYGLVHDEATASLVDAFDHRLDLVRSDVSATRISTLNRLERD